MTQSSIQASASLTLNAAVVSADFDKGHVLQLQMAHKDIDIYPEPEKPRIEYLLNESTGGKQSPQQIEAAWLRCCNKSVDGSKEMSAPSNLGVTLGRKWQPFNMRGMMEFQSANPYHSTCIQTKKNCLVGLGFRNPTDPNESQAGGSILQSQLQPSIQTQNKPTPSIGADGQPNPNAVNQQQVSQTLAQRQVLTKADKILNPLCDHTFRDIMRLIAEDYYQVGNGYMEIVRAEGTGDITGIHHIPAAEVFVWLETYQYDFHYEVIADEGIGGSRHFARWGDTKAFAARNGSAIAPWFGVPTLDQFNPGMVSEVIHFKNPSSRSRWYGFPDWLSCVSKIELTQCLDQHKYDFFLNRGVPEFMFFLTGGKLNENDWTLVANSLKSNIGLGNSHKSIALNLPNKDLKIELIKLAMEGHGEGADYATMADSFALAIVTAHRVPPLLAGIQIPGKLGANNELPNALMSFQATVLGPDQESFQQTLGMTLGNKAENGGLDLTPDDFLFRTVVEMIDVGTLDTQSKMRQPLATAQAQGRDMSAGVKS